MGYTHYWKVRSTASPDVIEAARSDMERVIAAAAAHGVSLANAHGEHGTVPGDFDGRWGFNGVDDDSYEAFLWPPDPDVDVDQAGFRFDFCKTNWRPYDAAVVACLLVAKERLGPDMQMGTDAEEEEAWAPGISLFRSTFGRDPSLIWPGDMEFDG
jgi:hypothetical protein